MVFKILHLADLHLDISFRDSIQAPLTSNARREGLRQALKRAFDLARERHVDAITIGGDLYEAERVSADTAQFLRQLFQQAAPTRILIAPGNHDPFTLHSVYNYVDWPPNVHVFREPRLAPLEVEGGLQIWGAAHDSPAFYQPLLTDFHVPEGRPAVLLLHATERSLILGQGKKAFCPLSLEEVRNSGFGLALLGHIHHQHLVPQGSPNLYYPGSPEPLGFDEESGHSVLFSEWDGATWRVEELDISQWTCRTAKVDVSDLDSRDQVIEHIRQMWPTERQSKKVLARILLTGQTSPSLDLNREAIFLGLGTEFQDLMLVDQTVPPFDLHALETEATTAGEFVRRVLKAIETAKQDQDDETSQCLDRALRFGLFALEGREIPEP